MFALGMLSWLYDRPAESTLSFLKAKFASRPEIMAANVAAFQAGWNFGETTEAFSFRYEVKPAALAPGTYRNISGNMALAYGLIAASQLAGLPLFLGSYPITPASDILHELAKHKRFGVRTFQAEDEIAAVGAALGASFGGSLSVTSTSGPGMLLKAETIGLAVSVELPLIVCDIQRAGPSTGMPTKTEQADLLQAMFGRNGESPVPIVAPASPAECFTAAIEAARIAVKYRTPVILLSDGYLANGSEPWRIPDTGSLPDLSKQFAFAAPADGNADGESGDFEPFGRDPVTLARPWALPGTPGLEHRIGGIEKADVTGTISYDPDNHDRMVRLRQAKVDGIAADIAPLEVDDPDEDAQVLVLGWGSTFGSIVAAVRRVRSAGHPVAQAHLRHLNPFPPNLGDVLRRYDRVLLPEINLGQLALLLRGRFLVDVISYNRVRGLPFRAAELAGVIEDVISHV
jgi:2-oxoglutarate/2-oxoacid ferredoxin oxidoreductase subunit alpha